MIARMARDVLAASFMVTGNSVPSRIPSTNPRILSKANPFGLPKIVCLLMCFSKSFPIIVAKKQKTALPSGKGCSHISFIIVKILGQTLISGAGVPPDKPGAHDRHSYSHTSVWWRYRNVPASPALPSDLLHSVPDVPQRNDAAYAV